MTGGWGAEQGGEAYFSVTPLLTACARIGNVQLEAGTHDGTKVLVCDRNL